MPGTRWHALRRACTYRRNLPSSTHPTKHAHGHARPAAPRPGLRPRRLRSAAERPPGARSLPAYTRAPSLPGVDPTRLAAGRGWPKPAGALWKSGERKGSRRGCAGVARACRAAVESTLRAPCALMPFDAGASPRAPATARAKRAGAARRRSRRRRAARRGSRRRSARARPRSARPATACLATEWTWTRPPRRRARRARRRRPPPSRSSPCTRTTRGRAPPPAPCKGGAGNAAAPCARRGAGRGALVARRMGRARLHDAAWRARAGSARV